MLNDPRLEGSKAEPSWTVRIALGRLGDQDQLQRFWCEAIREDAAGVQPILLQFGLVKGWYSYQALDRLLSPEGQIHFQRAAAKAEHTDVIFPGPKFDALDALHRLAPDAVPGQPSSLTQMDSMAVAARQWIAAHKTELEKQEPTGAGVNFSDSACKNGRPVKK